MGELRVHAFGRVCHLIVAGSDERAKELLHICQDELIRLENKFSTYIPNSVTSLINRAAGTGHSIPLDAETRSLFSYVDALWNESKHIFDPTTCILDEFYSSSGALSASPHQLEQKLTLVGWRNLEVTPNGAQLSEGGMQIDLNSCIRPYALDSLRKLLLKHDVSSAFIEMEQEVASIGRQPSGANWLVGMRVPTKSRAAIIRLKLNDSGFAFRGDFGQMLAQQGEVFGRALSPVDGQPIPGLLSVGVIADNCLTACSAASVARLKTEATGLKWLEKLGLPWIAVDRQLKCHGPLAQKG